MPFALIFVGLILLVTGVRNTQGQLFTLVKGDFTGSNNFVYWGIAVGGVTAIGYIDSLRVISDAFLTLVLIGLVFSQSGFFTKLTQQIAQTQSASTLGSILPTALTGLTALPALGTL